MPNENLPSLDFAITREEYETAMAEMVANIIDIQKVVNILSRKMNTQSEVIGCHRYILARFVPLPLLESAVKDYVKERGPQLDAEVRHNLSQIASEVTGDGKVH